MPWPREFEDDALEGGEPRCVEMFNDLDDCSGVKTIEPLIAIGQRTLNQLDAAALPFGQLVDSHALLRGFEGPPGNIHSEDRLELLLGQEKAQQLAFAAAKIKHPLRPRCLDRGKNNL